ncbi:ABC transporter permease, partial [Sulfurovum sp. bin170]|uniref:ABC transporter permease n=1 Tax=Sulfurovum sp. bin170 TaxID=2695268 RepID=UPI0013DF45BD
QGSFVPPGDPRRAASVAVLGPKLKRELFGEENALGHFVRIAGFKSVFDIIAQQKITIFSKN